MAAEMGLTMLAVHRNAAVKSRGRPQDSANRNGPVKISLVTRAAWTSALRLADGDASRLKIVNATTVIVVNNTRPHGRTPART